MSVNEFDFNAVKKRTMKVTLPDEDHTVVNIGVPSKKVMDKFLTMAANMKSAENDANLLNEVYAMVVDIFNTNTSGKKFTAANIKKWIEFDDLIYFFKAYTTFINDLAKN